MLNQFFLEREILLKIQRIERVCRLCKVDLTTKIKAKAEKLDLKIPEQLQAKMIDHEEEDEPKVFECKFCKKGFDDGRKLGGHISRAHANQKLEGEKLARRIKHEKVSSESEEEDSYPSKSKCIRKESQSYRGEQLPSTRRRRFYNRGSSDQQLVEESPDLMV